VQGHEEVSEHAIETTAMHVYCSGAFNRLLLLLLLQLGVESVAQSKRQRRSSRTASGMSHSYFYNIREVNTKQQPLRLSLCLCGDPIMVCISTSDLHHRLDDKGLSLQRVLRVYDYFVWLENSI
jgi:hypothetical protein